MIDIHLHILPGVDDGPATLQEALELAIALVQQGVSAAVATPHYNDEFPRRPVNEIRERIASLQAILHQYRIPLHLFVGHEALIQPGLLDDIYAGRLSTLNGSRYLLLELWNTSWLPETDRVIFELLANGIIPVLAHPERYRTIQHHPERLHGLLQQGLLTQLTASSLVGLQGNSAQKCAELLLKKGLISCIASDAHGLKRRIPAITQGLQRAALLVGPQRVHQMIEACPMSILNNQTMYEASQP